MILLLWRPGENLNLINKKAEDVVFSQTTKQILIKCLCHQKYQIQFRNITSDETSAFSYHWWPGPGYILLKIYMYLQRFFYSM